MIISLSISIDMPHCFSKMSIFLCWCYSFRYLATASSDHTVKIWNVDGFTLEKTLIGNSWSLVIIKCFLNSHLISQNFIFPDWGWLCFPGHQRWVWDCVFSVDGAYLITGTNLAIFNIYPLSYCHSATRYRNRRVTLKWCYVKNLHCHSMIFLTAN